MINSKTINVLIVGMSHMYGGTESFVMTLFRNIDRSIFHFIFLNVYDDPIACSDEIVSLGGEIVSLRLRRRADGIKNYKEGINRFFREWNNRIDIVLQNIQDLINIDMVKYAHKHNKKTVLWGHACDYGVKPRLLTRLSAMYNKITFNKYADLLVANSNKSGKWLYGNKQFVVVENFIDTNRFKYNAIYRKEIRDKFHINDGDILYGTLGRLSVEKNQLFLIDIFNKVHNKKPNTKLMIVGAGEMLHQLEKRVNDYKLGEYVIFTGETNQTEKYYSAFDIFVFPSRFEGFGISLLEAECSSLPCIVSDVIPDEAIKSPLVKKLSLSSDIDYWAENLLDVEANNSKENSDIVDYIEKNNGYINQTSKIAKMLEEVYG